MISLETARLAAANLTGLPCEVALCEVDVSAYGCSRGRKLGGDWQVYLFDWDSEDENGADIYRRCAVVPTSPRATAVARKYLMKQVRTAARAFRVDQSIPAVMPPVMQAYAVAARAAGIPEGRVWAQWPHHAGLTGPSQPGPMAVTRVDGSLDGRGEWCGRCDGHGHTISYDSEFRAPNHHDCEDCGGTGLAPC